MVSMAEKPGLTQVEAEGEEGQVLGIRQHTERFVVKMWVSLAYCEV